MTGPLRRLASRLARRFRADERGMTMVEMTVVTLILGVISIMVFDYLDSSSRLTLRAERQARTESELQLALRIVGQNVRGAAPVGDPCVSDGRSPALPTSYGSCLRFTVSRHDTGLTSCARSEYTYALVGTGPDKQLVENRVDYTGTTTCTSTVKSTRRVLLDKVVNSSAQPLFQYFNDDGSLVSSPDAAVASVKQAASIRITLAGRFFTDVDPLVLSTSVAPRNER